MGYRQLNEQSERTVVGSELDVHPKPNERLFVILRVTGVGVFAMAFVGIEWVFWVVLVGNVGKGVLGVAEGPGAVVEVGLGDCGTGGDADAPAFLQADGRAEIGGVEGDLGSFGSICECGPRMVVRNEHLEDGGWAGVVVLRLGWARLGKARQGKTGQSE